MKIIVGIVFFLLVFVAHADTVELKNGKTFDGTFIGRDGDNIKFEVDGITMMFNSADVKNISMGSAAQASGDKKEVATTGGNKKTQKITIPVGARLIIRIADTLNPKNHKKGYKFTAKLESALVYEGETIVPAGSNVYGVVLEAETSRRLAGKSSIKIGVTEIRINGVMHPMKTTELVAISEESAKKSAGQVGKWAAIGALADGSSGARTGAKVGLGAAILTGGKQTQIPAGTLLEFGLAEPLKIQ